MTGPTPAPTVADVPAAPHLTKTRYVAGLQCRKRLWLQVHRRDLATPPDAGLRVRLDAGEDVGVRAHGLFPGGVRVDEAHYRHPQGVRRTLELIHEAGVPILFEAFLEHAGVRVRADVLERLPDGTWGLREVKAAVRVRDEHVADLAVQRFVAEGMGLRVTSTELVHVNPEYVRGPGDIDWTRYFARVDVTDATAALLPDVAARVAAMHALLGQREMPAVAPGPQCFRPYACEFQEHCFWQKPDDWIVRMPRLDATTVANLTAAGVDHIADIPDDVALDPVQRRMRDAARTGRVQVDAGLAAALAPLGPPVDSLDFETLSSVVPVYAGSRPYQQVPAQWSLHRVAADGTVTHREFLDPLHGDPRPAFAASLLAALAEPNGPILVWGSFEDRVLSELAVFLPEHAPAIDAVRARLVDLHVVVRDHVYHPGFAGSFSLKRVAPVLAPGAHWKTSAPVAMGDEAGVALFRLATGRVKDPHEDVRLRRALLDYCACDTKAVLSVLHALRHLQ